MLFYREARSTVVKLERAGDLVYWTYHMLDWKALEQSPSDQKCVQCGEQMVTVGPVEDAGGSKYEGLACHSCRRVLWVRLP